MTAGGNASFPVRRSSTAVAPVVCSFVQTGVDGGELMAKATLSVVAAALMVLAAAISASAQITTGTVAGTIKDAQGAVIPGATVVLISEARGTKSAPATSSGSRRLRLPERHSRHLHPRSLDGRLQDDQALRRPGQRRRPRRGHGADPRSRRRGRDGRRHRGSRARAVAERRALVRDHDRADREPADQRAATSPASRSSRPA